MSDDWVIENLRVTLFSPKHKERVIIQNNRDDLRITSKESDESTRQEAVGKAAADKGASKRRTAPTPKPTDKAASAEAPAPATPPTSPAPNEAPSTRAKGSLKWRPTVDTGYTGFSAESHDGEFVVLKTAVSLWALYFSWGRGVHVALGCFRELGEAKSAAQKQHDEGPLRRPDGKITADMINKACPAPPEPSPPPTAPDPETSEANAPPKDAPRRRPRRAGSRGKKAKEPEPAKPPEPAKQPEPPPASKSDVEKDKELMGSFTSDLESVLDEDEDD